MQSELEQLVRRRAQDICEYCHLPEAIQTWRFEIDHIIAEQHGGETTAENLSLCCPKCNRHKGPNLAGIDPDTRAVVTLYHPRTQVWIEHFRWNGPQLVGLTACGRATIQVLSINDPVRVSVRQTLIEEGIFP